MQYIHQNPVVEGWVEHAHEYLYSSARDYAGNKGLVNIALAY
jgi:putative transposase